MSEPLYSLENLADLVALEGLDYAIQHYLSPDRIEDEEMRGLWRQAQEILDEIERRLPDRD